MNNDRRKYLATVAPLLTQITQLAKEAKTIIETVKDEEQEAFDNMSEGRQQGDKGQEMEAAIAEMDGALDELNALDLTEVVEQLERAADRALAVDAEKGRLTKAEAEQRREERLPQWAKDRYARLEQAMADLEDRFKSQYADATGDPSELLVEDYMSPLRGKVLPFDSVRLGDLIISICAHEKGALQIRSNLFTGDMVVRPRSSNEVIIAVIN
jgi:hypothetical protein